MTTKPKVIPPTSWAWIPLSDVARLESGHTPSRRIDAYWEGGEVPWLSLKDIRSLSSKYVTETVDHPTILGIANSSARLLPKGTVALCRTASVGKVAILGKEMATSQDFVNWVCGEQLLPEYLYWAFKSSEATFSLEKQGSTHQTIYMPTVARFHILLPPMPEQRRIAEVLDRAEALRVKRRAALAQLDDLTQAIFLDLFGDPVTNPKGWAMIRLEDLLAMPLRNGLSPSHTGKVVAKVLTLSAVTGDGFDASALKTSTFQSTPPPDQSVNEEDFLICRGNGNVRLVGKGYFPTGRLPDVTFPDTMIAARVSPDRIVRAFLQHVWGTAAVRRQIESLARTTNGTFKVNQTMLEGMTFVAPPLPLQHEFARRVAAVDKLKTAHRASLAELDALFASLQHRAFRGEL